MLFIYSSRCLVSEHIPRRVLLHNVRGTETREGLKGANLRRGGEMTKRWRHFARRYVDFGTKSLNFAVPTSHGYLASKIINRVYELARCNSSKWAAEARSLHKRPRVLPLLLIDDAEINLSKWSQKSYLRSHKLMQRGKTGNGDRSKLYAKPELNTE